MPLLVDLAAKRQVVREAGRSLRAARRQGRPLPLLVLPLDHQELPEWLASDLPMRAVRVPPAFYVALKEGGAWPVAQDARTCLDLLLPHLAGRAGPGLLRLASPQHTCPPGDHPRRTGRFSCPDRPTDGHLRSTASWEARHRWSQEPSQRCR